MAPACIISYLLTFLRNLRKKLLTRLKKTAGVIAMTALNEYLLLERLTKGLVGIVFFISVFGFLWFSAFYTAFDVICILGLLFRFFFSIKGNTSLWKIILTMCFYLKVIYGQVHSSLFVSANLLEFLLNVSSDILIITVLIVIFSDLLRYRYLKQRNGIFC